MAFRITITEDAERQFRALSARDRRILQVAIVSRLRDQPTSLSRAVKRLRPNPVAGYELRAGDLRALYDVEGDEVIISVVGVKAGNTLIVAGEAYHAHQEPPPESPGSRPEGSVD